MSANAPAPAAAPVQKPLSLVLEIATAATPDQESKMLGLGGAIAQSSGGIPGNGILHFAWVIPIGPGKFLLSTVYDGDFEKYLDVFIDSGHAAFDEVLPHVKGGKEIVPVQEHRQGFYKFVRDNDITKAGTLTSLFSAYPTLTVVDIIQATS